MNKTSYFGHSRIPASVPFLHFPQPVRVHDDFDFVTYTERRIRNTRRTRVPSSAGDIVEESQHWKRFTVVVPSHGRMHQSQINFALVSHTIYIRRSGSPRHVGDAVARFVIPAADVQNSSNLSVTTILQERRNNIKLSRHDART